MYGLIQRLAQVAADDVLVAELSPQGGTTQLPVEIAVQVDAEDIGAVVVERHLVLGPPDEFKTVIRAIPVDGRAEVEPSFGLALNGRIYLRGFLVLFVEFGTVEGVRAEPLYG